MAAEAKSNDPAKKSDANEISPPIDKNSSSSPPLSPKAAFTKDLYHLLKSLEHAVLSKELRIIPRILYPLAHLRKTCVPSVIVPLWNEFGLTKDDPVQDPNSLHQRIADFIAQASENLSMDIEQDQAQSTANGNKDTQKYRKQPYTEDVAPVQQEKFITVESKAFVRLFVNIFLLDRKQYKLALEASLDLLSFLSHYSRRTMDEINAKAYFFYYRAHELCGNLYPVHNRLLPAYRTSVLHHDSTGQAMLINLLLRNYISFRLYDQADRLVSKTVFPETRSNNQLARYLYYLGRIKSIQLDYTEALRCLQEALRKAPQSTALGFRTIVQKFMIIVQLLTGQIPERSVFRQTAMVSQLKPYFQLTQAIMIGDLVKFKQVVENSELQFVKDETWSLIMRLHHNVIKTALRKINTVYSRISLEDIKAKLHLDSVTEAEGVVAKATRDEVINAIIDHKNAIVELRENVDTYSTIEPSNAFHNRISFCLNIYNDSIKAMRFPEKEEDEEEVEARRERMKEEQELANVLSENLDDDDEDEF